MPIRGQRFCLFNDVLFADPEEDLIRSLSERHSHPRFLVESWLDEYGEDKTIDLLWAGNEPPSLWLRPAPGKLEALSRELTKREIRHDVEEEAPAAIRSDRASSHQTSSRAPVDDDSGGA